MNEHPQDLIHITNPTDEDFEHEYAKARHILRSGETSLKPRYLAEHLCKHLKDSEINKNKENHRLANDPNVRRKWRDKIILGVQEYFQPEEELSEGERIRREAERKEKEHEERIKKLENETAKANTKPTGKGAGSTKKKDTKGVSG